MTWKQGLSAVGLEEVPGGGRAKMGKAREGTSEILSKKKCLQMHPGWGDATDPPGTGGGKGTRY